MEWGDSFTLTAVCMKGTGLMTRLMGRECSRMLMDQSMKESLKMTCKKVKERKNGQMEVSLLATFKMGRKKGMGFSNLLMGLRTKEVFILGKWKERAKRQILTGLCMRETLRIIEKTAREFVTGLMEETTKGTLC